MYIYVYIYICIYIYLCICIYVWLAAAAAVKLLLCGPAVDLRILVFTGQNSCTGNASTFQGHIEISWLMVLLLLLQLLLVLVAPLLWPGATT